MVFWACKGVKNRYVANQFLNKSFFIKSLQQMIHQFQHRYDTDNKQQHNNSVKKIYKKKL